MDRALSPSIRTTVPKPWPFDDPATISGQTDAAWRLGNGILVARVSCVLKCPNHRIWSVDQPRCRAGCCYAYRGSLNLLGPASFSVGPS